MLDLKCAQTISNNPVELKRTARDLLHMQKRVTPNSILTFLSPSLAAISSTTSAFGSSRISRLFCVPICSKRKKKILLVKQNRKNHSTLSHHLE